MAYNISRWRKGFQRINTRYLRQVATQITQMVEFGCHSRKAIHWPCHLGVLWVPRPWLGGQADLQEVRFPQHAQRQRLRTVFCWMFMVFVSISCIKDVYIYVSWVLCLNDLHPQDPAGVAEQRTDFSSQGEGLTSRLASNDISFQMGVINQLFGVKKLKPSFDIIFNLNVCFWKCWAAMWWYKV